MFKDAVAIAAGYTFPVVLSRQSVKGDISASIGAYVVINSDGWIVTAGHIVEQLSRLTAECQQVAKHDSDAEAIRKDPQLTANQKAGALRKLGRLSDDTTRYSGAWWGHLGNADVQLKSSKVLPAIDLAVGQLEPFDPAWVKVYPKFKDPKTPIRQGTSLCKYGFPFNSLAPIRNAAANRFEFPPGSVPIPGFPIDGIVTRSAETRSTPGPALAYPQQWVVTSTPGLKGQSGGPTFDVRGVVCAIQCQTSHLPLGFDPDVPGKPGVKEHQFLNVGLGVHPVTFCGLFDELGVKYATAAD